MATKVGGPLPNSTQPKPKPYQHIDIHKSPTDSTRVRILKEIALFIKLLYHQTNVAPSKPPLLTPGKMPPGFSRKTYRIIYNTHLSLRLGSGYIQYKNFTPRASDPMNLYSPDMINNKWVSHHKNAWVELNDQLSSFAKRLADFAENSRFSLAFFYWPPNTIKNNHDDEINGIIAKVRYLEKDNFFREPVDSTVDTIDTEKISLDIASE